MSAAPGIQHLSGIRDNHARGRVVDFVRTKTSVGSDLSIVSAYFTIHAYDALSAQLDEVRELRFLFGEPRFVSSIDPDKTASKAFAIENDELQLANRLQQREVARRCAAWIDAKVQIRSIRKANLLHGKMYHIHDGHRDHAIVGSSNFTVKGLGATAEPNLELNLIVDGDRDRADLLRWFEDIWTDRTLVEDVKDKVLAYLAQLYAHQSPEFVYFKTLFHVFERYLADQDAGGLLDSNIKIVDSAIWKSLFEFQRDGVKGAINKILKHNGCILADSVGLGKTYEALAIIRYFELRNDRVLVLCPKKLRDNWTVYRQNDALNPFIEDRFRFDVLSHTDLSRDHGKSGDIDLATLNWGNYDLVVIDESHNFRNNAPGQRDEDGNIVRRSRYARLLQDILQKGVKTRVLLLSATPVNNDLRDLRNQIYLLSEGDDDAFADSIGIPSLKSTLAGAQKTFTQWATQPGDQRRTQDLMLKLSSAFFKLLDELTIARSRKHIQRYYASTIAELGGFPRRLKPTSIHPAIDLQDNFLSYDKVYSEISGYKLALFAPSRYVKPEFKDLYQTGKADPFSQATRETYLIGMMRMNFLKRLESSIFSFAATMERTKDKIDALTKRIRRYQDAPHQNPDLDNFTLDLSDGHAGEDGESDDSMPTVGKMEYRLEHLNLMEWLQHLQQDRDQIIAVHGPAKNVTPQRDAKLKELRKLIESKVKKPTTTKLGTPNRKVLVFTAFSDTARYLYDSLATELKRDLGIHVALVTGGGENKTTLGKTDYNQILTNFAPRAKKRDKIPGMPQTEEIDLLIATDCISEGQNLQDCDYLVNYDIHWNPVRIIQRFGRIDRIGSINETVQLVNFWPTQDLDRYVNLKSRVESRMALVDIAATFEDNILNSDEVEELVKADMKYRDKQLLKLKDEVLDLEDFAETVALNEFTLDDFRIELSNYIAANRQKLEDAAMGLYAVVPPHPEQKVIAPGVVFCLRQPGASAKSETVNPLQPYFLVYVRDDGEVRYNFTSPKQVLELMRAVCQGKASAYTALCDAFDAGTADGKDMSKYSALLGRAVDGIAAQLKRRNLSNLFSGRQGQLLGASDVAESTADFELITWLVIKEG